MRIYRYLLLAGTLALAVMPAAEAAAQNTGVFVTGSRGMLGVMTEAVRENGVVARQRAIVSVVPGSGAERAGLAAGDTILRVNGLAATQQIMNAGFEPGDTVVLSIRREGRERDVTVVASERQNRFTWFSTDMLPDTVRGRMSIIMNAVREGTDSTLVMRFGNDSIHGFHYGRFSPLQLDSLSRFHGAGPWEAVMGMTFPPDSLFRFSERMLPRGDGRAFAYSFGVDSVNVMRPAEFIARGYVAGMSAVAGAELSELNPGLAEYFGTASGVLVLNAREGTPAERAGLMAGDVILRANDRDVSSIVELRRAVEQPAADAARGAARGEPPRREPTKLDVLRRGQRMVITIGGTTGR